VLGARQWAKELAAAPAHYGFLPPGDECVKATVLGIADELARDGLVLRYQVTGTDKISLF
jgi:GH15 family glucan-1,4-alpha-glucosidase